MNTIAIIMARGGSKGLPRKKLSCGDRTYKPCNVCDVNGTLNGKKSFDRWQKYFAKTN